MLHVFGMPHAVRPHGLQMPRACMNPNNSLNCQAGSLSPSMTIAHCINGTANSLKQNQGRAQRQPPFGAPGARGSGWCHRPNIGSQQASQPAGQQRQPAKQPSRPTCQPASQPSNQPTSQQPSLAACQPARQSARQSASSFCSGHRWLTQAISRFAAASAVFVAAVLRCEYSQVRLARRGMPVHAPSSTLLMYQGPLPKATPAW